MELSNPSLSGEEHKVAFSRSGPMRGEILEAALSAKGFLSEGEGVKLFELARSASRNAPCLEIGSYCGKSSLFLGEGCRVTGCYVLFSIDHHRGSEEQKPGQPYFDAELYDASAGRINTLPHFLRNLEQAGLLDWVIPIVGDSARVAKNWTSRALSLVFIDGGHSDKDVISDYECWSPLVIPGGYLCFHDVYPNPADGGQAPYRMFEQARKLSKWRFIGLFESLGVLERK